MKRGFTLIEVLAVLVLLGIISLIAYPIVSRSVNDSREKAYQLQIDNIEEGAYKWSIDNLGELSKDTTISVNISDLISGGYITKTEDGKLYNPKKNNEVMNGCVIIRYSTEYNQYLYNYDEECKLPVEYVDNSGANKPELYDKMIPVIYENNNWVYADINEKWYDYDAKEWANAVVLNDGVTKSVGDTIDIETDVALMFVWIPRYKYTIFNGKNGSLPPEEIDIVFESGLAKTGTIICTTSTSVGGAASESCTDTTGIIDNYMSTYTHPAFCFGHRTDGICNGEELTGIWVGKFENSTTDTSCNTNQNEASCSKVLPVTIKPNVRSWRYANVSNFYTSIGNISTNYGMNVDSHMMKNMEWGAVAYLTQSKYGRCDNGDCTEVSKNDSSDYYTGRSLGRPSSASGEYSSSGTYTYELPLGQLASTTGNIYGIYDMSGGSWDYVMGNMVNSSNQFYSSSGGFSTNLLNKYYDAYTYDTSNTTHSRGRLGDATKETLQTYGSYSGGWYDDYANFPNSTFAWFVRGGSYSSDARAGVFGFDRNNGSVNGPRATRSVIIANN